MQFSACLLLSLSLGAPWALAQQTGASAAPDPAGPQIQSPAPTPLPDSEGVYRLGPGLDPPSVSTPAMATLPDGSDTTRPRIVRFSAVIAADGSVTKLAVVNPMSDAFETAAATAIQQSKFAPGLLNGSPVPVAVCLRVPFIHVQPAIPRVGACPQPGAFGPGPAFRMPPGVMPPRPTHTANPEYSDEARKKHIQGVVLLSTLVNEQGQPTDIRIERSLGYGLDEKAEQAVSQYRFQPAIDRDGKPVAVRITIEVNFRLY